MTRKEYEMTEDDLKQLLESCRQMPVMLVGGVDLSSTTQDNANRAWRYLGEKMGFDSDSVRPICDKGQRFFTAITMEGK